MKYNGEATPKRLAARREMRARGALVALVDGRVLERALHDTVGEDGSWGGEISVWIAVRRRDVRRLKRSGVPVLTATRKGATVLCRPI